MVYYAKITPDGDGIWCLHFVDFTPDLILDEGNTLEQALHNGAVTLRDYLSLGLPPTPNLHRQGEEHFYAIEVEPAMVAALNIRLQRHKLGYTQQEMAQALGLQQPNYARLEKSGKMDLTMLDKIAKTLKVNKAQLIDA